MNTDIALQGKEMGDLQGMVRDLLGTYAQQQTLYNRFPWYQKEGSKTGALFLTDDGRWTIAKGLGKEQVIRSKSVSSSEPPNDRGWEIRDMNNSWNNEPSLYMKPFNLPDLIYINESGYNSDVGHVLGDKKVNGNYTRIDSYYVRKHEPALYLFQNSDGVWVLGPSLEAQSVFLHFVGGIVELAEGGGTWKIISSESDNTTVILSLIMLHIIVGIVVSS